MLYLIEITLFFVGLNIYFYTKSCDFAYMVAQYLFIILFVYNIYIVSLSTFIDFSKPISIATDRNSPVEKMDDISRTCIGQKFSFCILNKVKRSL